MFNTKEIFNKIKEVEVFFISEIIVREKIRKTLKKYITALTFVDKNLLLLWVQAAVWIFCSKCISVWGSLDLRIVLVGHSQKAK